MGKLDKATFLSGDAKEKLKEIEAGSVQTAITSPPYWGLRDYERGGQIGVEETVEEYVQNLVEVGRGVRHVLSDDGTFWLNIGDGYAVESVGSLKQKDLCLMPSRVALALQDDGWYVRSRIVWNKKSCMPENVDDRPTSSHEYIFLLSKSETYYYDADAIKEDLAESSKERYKYAYGGKKNEALKETDNPRAVVGQREMPNGKNKRDVWTVDSGNFPDAHFAVYPTELIEPCVLAGSAEGDTVLDPFSGAGSTGIAALKNGRKYIGVELNEDYIELSKDRIRNHEDVPTNHNFW